MDGVRAKNILFSEIKLCKLHLLSILCKLYELYSQMASHYTFRAYCTALKVFTSWHTLKNDSISVTCLLMQWIRICLPMQGTWVWSLVREYSTCHGASKPMCHNYRACLCSRAHELQPLNLCVLEPTWCNYWNPSPRDCAPQ